jgi:hypothetical protein
VVQGPIRLPRRVGPGGRTTEYPPNEWPPEEVERRIVGEAVEWLYVFDPLGRQVARFRGTADFVDLSEELKARAAGLYGESVLRNHLIVHNHPVTLGRDAVSSFPPSPSDLFMAVERDIRELRVVSGGWRYVVQRPGDDWPTDEYELKRLFDAATEELNEIFGFAEETAEGGVRRLQLKLHRLAGEGWISYEQTISAGSD